MSASKGHLGHHLHLHLIIFIWGFTGILGELITIPSPSLVWYRMLIAFAGLWVFLKFVKAPVLLNKKLTLQTLGVGIIIAAHWIFFFGAIKISTVSVALACMASTSLFTSLLEPLFFKRKIILYEVIFGLIVILGLYIIFRFEGDYTEGIMMAILSSFLAALFSVFNGILVKDNDSRTLSLYEMIGGFLGITIFLALTGGFTIENFSLSTSNLGWLLILGLVCTAYAFAASVELMKTLSPFTVSISINMEPVYAILLALVIFGEKEKMTPGFYVGAGIIFLTVIGNAVLKSRKKE